MSCHSQIHRIVGLVLLILSCSCLQANASCNKRPLTSAEKAYYESVTSLMETALPAPEGWRRRVLWMPVPSSVCEGFKEKPILHGGQFKYIEITELDRFSEKMALQQKALEDKVLAASERGDFAEVSRLQNELQQLITENLATYQKLQLASRNKPKPAELIAKFRINEPRKVIGKKFEISARPHTSKTFERINGRGSERETVTVMLYIGNWRVEDFIKNWNLFRPDVFYTAIGALRLELTGKRTDVEAYLSDTVQMSELELATK